MPFGGPTTLMACIRCDYESADSLRVLFVEDEIRLLSPQKISSITAKGRVDNAAFNAPLANLSCLILNLPDS